LANYGSWPSNVKVSPEDVDSAEFLRQLEIAPDGWIKSLKLFDVRAESRIRGVKRAASSSNLREEAPKVTRNI
jgi:hypothetical protein